MLLPFDNRVLLEQTRQLDIWAPRLDERIISRRWSGRLRRALEAEAVAASTSMEGVPVTVSDAARILAGDPPEDVEPKDRALVIGYRDAMRYVQRRADDGLLEWNRELLVGVQDRVLAGDFGAGAGRVRTGAAWVRNSQSGEVVFEPPQHEELPALVDEICTTLTGSQWHPAIASAWLHVAIAAVHPFKDGNGRTARVLASLAMYRGGFRHPAFTSLEEWWGRYPRSYYEAFGCLGKAFDRNANVTPFVEVHVQAQLSQVLSLALRQRTEGRLWTTLENLLEDAGLPTRLANALYDSFFGREMTTGYYADLVEASQGTARNDLASAAAARLLVSEGRTRGRKYLPGPRLMKAIAEQLGNVAPDAEAILPELVRRSADGMQWTEATAVDVPSSQESLPGFG
jgi:Fic family protein